MKCPLKTIAMMISSRNTGMNVEDTCLQTNCALWNSNDGLCAIRIYLEKKNG